MKERKPKLFLFFLLVFSQLSVIGQISVKGSVRSTGEAPIYLSVYWKNTHQLIRPNKRGKFSFRLAAYEECLLAVYQEGKYPKVFSINTFVATQQKLQLKLQLTKSYRQAALDFNTAPTQRILTTAEGQTNHSFELDAVADKLNFSQMMTRLSKDLQNFYHQGILPSVRLDYDDAQLSESELGKSEHRIGVEIYDLLKKKKKQDQQVKHLDAIANASSTCPAQLSALQTRVKAARLQSELSFKRLDREKLRFQRRQAKGQAASAQTILLAQETATKHRRRYEIAALNYRNRQLDCWEDRLQKSVDRVQAGEGKLSAAELQLRQLDISDLRYQRRIENALQLYEHHQALSKLARGRERVVQLAKSQKYIAAQEQLRFQQKENAVWRWELRVAQQASGQSQLIKARQVLERQRAVAYQAEMAYLEHMWHLRDQPGMHEVANELYQQGEGLSRIGAFRPPPTSGSDVALTALELQLEQQVKISEEKDERGTIKALQYREDYYEIVVDKKGRRRYFKNRKPITKLTYAFETKRLFGEILENLRYEEANKARLFDFFRKKVN